MRAAMFTMGTRGDVQPYIFLARAMSQNGHEVSLGSHPCWRGLIEEAGIRFIPIGPDINIEQEAAAIRGKNSNPALSMFKTTMIYGIPSIPVPHVLDQMGFAKQLTDAGVATQALRAKDSSEETIYAAVIDMLKTYKEKSDKAKEISLKIRTEGGLDEAVRLIENAVNAAQREADRSSS